MDDIHQMAESPPEHMLHCGSLDICTVCNIGTLFDIGRDREPTAALWCRSVSEAPKYQRPCWVPASFQLWQLAARPVHAAQYSQKNAGLDLYAWAMIRN